jgi:oligoendopeptidase F
MSTFFINSSCFKFTSQLRTFIDGAQEELIGCFPVFFTGGVEMKNEPRTWLFIILVFAFAGIRLKATEGKMSGATKERSEVSEQHKWKLEDIYPALSAWEEDLKKVSTEAEAFDKCRGRLSKSAGELAKCLDLRFAIEKRLDRLSTYASLAHDQDARVVEAQALYDRISKIRTDYGAKLSFLEPELLSIAPKKLSAFLRSDLLKDYRQFVDNLTRRRAHILAAEQEEIVARTGNMSSLPQDVYRTLSTLNLPFPEVVLQDGQKVALTQALYTRHRAASSREDRTSVFHAFFGTYQKFRETFAGLLSGVVYANRFSATVRKYPGDLESALDSTNVPVSIYTNMIAQVRAGRPLLWRYLGLRKKILNLKELGYQDLYASLVPAASFCVSFEEAKGILLSALASLGKESVEVIERAFSERWTDVYPTAGKRSGAYMSGSAYDVHPYVLLNFNENYESMSTTAHEFGHALHSYLSNRHQPYVNSGYPTFTAEVASTVNENLLRHYLAKIEKDPQKKLFLLGEYLENFRQTVFRQAMFAEFELSIHRMAEAGEPMTADRLNQEYLTLLRAYYGEAEGVTRIDPLYAVEWAYIPHFYYNFYMFQYTTSFVAASAIAARIFDGEASAREQYLQMLKAGGSMYPLDLLRLGGVDMTGSKPYEEAFQTMEAAIREIEELTASLNPPAVQP